MPRADKPANERERMAVLAQCDVLDTPPEPGFDDLTALAASLLRVPIALVSLIDQERQYFKSVVGLCATETDRDSAFCAHALLLDKPLVISDATLDPRTSDNKLVTGEPFIRFYAGAQLRTSDGFVLGTLCVIDTKPREFGPDQLDILQKLARQALSQLELRRSHRLAAEAMERALTLAGEVATAVTAEKKTAEQLRVAATEITLERERLALAMSSGGLGCWDWNPQTGEELFDQRLLEILGEQSLRAHSEEWVSRIHPEDVTKAVESAKQHLAGKTSVYEFEQRMRHRDGSWRWISGQGRVVTRDAEGRPTRMVGTYADVTERMRVESAAAEAAEKLREAAAVLATERERLALALSSGGLATWDWNILTGELLVDARWLEIVGERSIRPHIDECTSRVHPDDQPELMVMVERHFAGETPVYEHTHRLRHKDGSWRWVIDRGVVVSRDSKGKPLRMVGTHADVTEKVSAAEAARAADEMLHRTGAMAQVGGWETDVQSQRVTWSKEVYDIHDLEPGTPMDAGKGMSFFEPDAAAKLDHAARAAIEAGQQWELELPLTTAKGRSIWVRLQGEPVLRDGQVVTLRGAMQDVTEQTRAKQWLKSLVNNLPGVAFRVACDAKWTNLFVSDAIENLTGYPATDFINNAVRDCASITHADDVELVERTVLEAVENRMPYSIEYRIIHKSGAVRWVNERAQVVFDGATPMYLDGVMFDMTERKAAETSLIEARAAADEASRSKSEFLANMSHEIRTPLTAILGYADLLATDEEAKRSAESRSEIVGTIRHAGEHLLTVVNDILDISKIEAGKMVVESVETNLAELLQGIESLLASRATEKGLTLELCLGTPVPRIVRTDPTRVRQVLMNLVGNAIKFTDKGAVRIEVGGRERGEHFELCLAVRDTGPGLDEVQAARLFAAFVQADTTVTRRHGGTGLGLVICQRLARMMGGDVVLTRSAPGEGSEFTATFAVGRVTGAAMLTDLRQHAAESSPLASIGAITLSGRILLAEDGVDNQRLIGLYLKKAGAQVDIAENGRIALELIDAAANAGWAYDLLLTDMQMPEIDGYTLATTLRERGSQLAIVALTAHAMAADRNKCIEAGCDDYASKPIDRKALVASCAAWLGRRGGVASGGKNGVVTGQTAG